MWGKWEGNFRVWGFPIAISYPKGPCIQILHTLALKYLYRDYIEGQCIYSMSTWTLTGSLNPKPLLMHSFKGTPNVFGCMTTWTLRDNAPNDRV